METKLRVLVSCEHGGCRIPAPYRPLFRGATETLESHAGHDVGALAVARAIARSCARRWPTRLIYSTTSRLLVDLNRSLGHPRLHGEPIRALDDAGRRAVLELHYLPYRRDAEAWIEAGVTAGARVVHVSCHTFTPRLDGTERKADIGLLFDPARHSEARLARAWRDALRAADAALRVRLNYPYRGTADGMTTALRRRFADGDYAGLELEVNQSYPLGEPGSWRSLRQRIAVALAHALTPDFQRAPSEATNGPNRGPDSRSRDVRPARFPVR